MISLDNTYICDSITTIKVMFPCLYRGDEKQKQRGRHLPYHRGIKSNKINYNVNSELVSIIIYLGKENTQ